MINNKKGFTVIEILLTFTLVSIIMISLFQLIMNYKNKQQIEAFRRDIITYKYKITKLLQDDLVVKGISNIVVNSNASYTITLKNNEERTLNIDKDNYIISYNNIKYPLPNIDGLSIEGVDVSLTPLVDDDTFSYHFLSVDVGIRHIDLKEDYGIHITDPIIIKKTS